MLSGIEFQFRLNRPNVKMIKYLLEDGQKGIDSNNECMVRHQLSHNIEYFHRLYQPNTTENVIDLLNAILPAN